MDMLARVIADNINHVVEDSLRHIKDDKSKIAVLTTIGDRADDLISQIIQHQIAHRAASAKETDAAISQ